MAFTDHLRQQHADILRLATRLGDLLDKADDTPDEMRSLVSSLGTALVPHLALEDSMLYPRLAAHHDPEVRALAGRFIAEMSDLRAQVERFDARWTAPDIRARRAEFRTAAQAILAALAERIRRENVVLYPVADEAMLTLRVGAPR